MAYEKRETVMICKDGSQLRHVVKGFTARQHSKGARVPKKNKTRDAQARVNRRNRENSLWYKIQCNFSFGDSHAVLHYWKNARPDSIVRAENDLNKTLRLCYDRCRRKNIPYKSIAVIEMYGKKGVLYHHHIVINREAVSVLEACWRDVLARDGRNGSVSDQHLDNRESHRELARYLLKHSERAEEEWRRLGFIRKNCWKATRNIVTPRTRRTGIRANKWSIHPRPQKGERLLKNEYGEVCQIRINEVTGWEWCEYVGYTASKEMLKIKRRN